MNPLKVVVNYGYYDKLVYSGYTDRDGSSQQVPAKDANWIDQSWTGLWVDSVHYGGITYALVIRENGIVESMDIDNIKVTSK